MIWRGLIGATLAIVIAAAAGPAAAQGKKSGLPIPRFVSLGSSEVNVRTGPGKRYPVSWMFVRRGLPVMVVDEFDHWRRIVDSDGAVGWVHKALLSGRRTALVSGATRPLFREPNPASSALLLAEENVQGRLLRCEPNWCEVEIADRRGWMQREHLFGVLKDEVF
ncbi:MAG: hypothetical protein MI806_17110 [Minwuiales bacterium]|nr:hypothetical protein [Minwuiales bacterium]